MRSAGTRPGACSASNEARRDVNDKSPIIDGGEKVEKMSETSAMCTKIGRSPSDDRQCPGRSPAISHRRCTDFSKTAKARRLIG